ELATRTVFNVLGPLTNPAGARAQIVGVYSPGLVRTIAEVLAQLGARRAFVVHGAGGIDELSPCGPNQLCEVVDGGVRERTIDPEALGIDRCSPEELRGGSPAENAQAIRVDERFAGSLDDLRAARAAAKLPLLAKGFFTEERHLNDVKAAGADAALLIPRDLDDRRATALMQHAETIGLDTLVEARDATE